MFDIASYREAKSVAEAITLLQADPGSHLIAGGTDLLIRMREGKLPDARLINLHDVPELKEISMDAGGAIRIGAGASFSAVASHPLIQEHLPILAEAAATVGGPQIRNAATLGGNICNGAVSADSAGALLVLNAGLEIEGPAGSRYILARDFYKGPGQVDLQPAEVLTAVCVKAEDYRDTGGAYIKYAARKAMDIATLGCAVLCRAEGEIVTDFRLAFTVAAPTPVRCPQTEALVIGQRFGETLLRQMAAAALREIQPRTSWRASREFRIHLAEELSRRAFRSAFARVTTD